MSISSDPTPFLRRARKIGCPEAAISAFLAQRPAKGMICTVNGNSRFALQGDVASYYEADNMPGYDFPASIRLRRTRGAYEIVRIRSVLEPETLGRWEVTP